MERYTPCAHSKLGHLQAVIGMEMMHYSVSALLDLNILILIVHRSCMLAPSLHIMFRDFRDLIQKRITNKFLTCKREKSDTRKRNIKTLGLTYDNFAVAVLSTIPIFAI